MDPWFTDECHDAVDRAQGQRATNNTNELANQPATACSLFCRSRNLGLIYIILRHPVVFIRLTDIIVFVVQPMGVVVVRRPIAYNIQTSHLQNDADVLLISADARYRHTQGGKGAAAIAAMAV